VPWFPRDDPPVSAGRRNNSNGAKLLSVSDDTTIKPGKGADVISLQPSDAANFGDKLIIASSGSKAGGITVYQFDPTDGYAYYYAHLERYADGLKEKDHVKRGQVLGYVGTSGNAPRDTPHLHFAIFRLTDEKQWWRGNPIDPYEVLK